MNQRAMNWIIGNDTGTSSKTIWAIMQGCVKGVSRSGGNFDVPYDPADFGRCFRLLQLIPEWKKDLQKVAKHFPKWKPLVDAWPELEALYMEELNNRDGKAPKLYERMRILVDEGRILDGWKHIGRGSWERYPREGEL